MPQDPEKGISGFRRRLRDEKEQERGKMLGRHFLEKGMVV